MSKREQLCLQMRNKKGEGQAEETYCRHYIKKRGAYLKYLFFHFQSTSLFLMSAIVIAAAVFLPSDGDELFRIIPIAMASITSVSYLFIIFKGLWYYKYDRHVFVTDEGIWVMSCSVMWWRGAPDFMGKRRFLAPSWSLYSWSELKSVGLTHDSNTKNVSKIMGAFEDFDNFVIKS